jgi:hypothetical protein
MRRSVGGREHLMWLGGAGPGGSLRFGRRGIMRGRRGWKELRRHAVVRVGRVLAVLGCGLVVEWLLRVVVRSRVLFMWRAIFGRSRHADMEALLRSHRRYLLFRRVSMMGRRLLVVMLHEMMRRLLLLRVPSIVPILYWTENSSARISLGDRRLIVVRVLMRRRIWIRVVRMMLIWVRLMRVSILG